MNNEQIGSAFLETLAFSDLVKLADEYGVDVPEDLDRRFLIAELLELAHEELESERFQMVVTDGENIADFANGNEKNKNNEKTDGESCENDSDSQASYQYDRLDLPKNYNETQIAGILRNPTWLFVFWNISDFDQTKVKKNRGATLKLRICLYENKEDKSPIDSFEVQLVEDSQEQYVLLPKDSHFVKAELVIFKQGGGTEILASSSLISIPKISSWIKELDIAKEIDFSPAARLSGVKEVLLEQYKNHRHSFI